MSQVYCYPNLDQIMLQMRAGNGLWAVGKGIGSSTLYAWSNAARTPNNSGIRIAGPRGQAAVS